jgi:hypothetical protein
MLAAIEKRRTTGSLAPSLTGSQLVLGKGKLPVCILKFVSSLQQPNLSASKEISGAIIIFGLTIVILLTV